MNQAALVRFWLAMIGAAGALELFDFMFGARAMPDQGVVALNVVAFLAWGFTRRLRGVRPRRPAAPLPQ
jgi:hypothetical protein